SGPVALGGGQPEVDDTGTECRALDPVTLPEGARAYLDGLLDVVAAQTALAITRARVDRHRRGADSVLDGHLPRPGETGGSSERASVAHALARVAAATGLAAQHSELAQAQRRLPPFLELLGDFGLDDIQAQVLLVVLAPSVRGEIAELYRELAGDSRRALCDRYLIEVIVGGESSARRAAVARAVAPGSALVDSCLLRVADHPAGEYLFAPVTVDPTVLVRVCDRPLGDLGVAVTRHQAERPLAEVVVPDDFKQRALAALTGSGREGLRLFILGSRGSGRRTLCAALAMATGRRLAVIDVRLLPRDARAMSEELRRILQRTRVLAMVTCISGIETIDD
ncbi:MAG: hypothetical protein AAGC55_34500, partial [Myxococcota bacterium]